MKQFILVFLMVLLPSAAFSENNNSSSLICRPIEGKNIDKVWVDNFLKFAKSLGLPCPAYYAEAGNRALIEYLPLGENFKNWKNMLTVNITDTGEQDAKLLTLPITENFVNRTISFGGKAKVITYTPKDDPSVMMHGQRFVVQYSVGEGATRENSIAIVRTIGKHFVSVIHYQQRGGELSEDQVRIFLKNNGLGRGTRK